MMSWNNAFLLWVSMYLIVYASIVTATSKYVGSMYHTPKAVFSPT